MSASSSPLCTTIAKHQAANVKEIFRLELGSSGIILACTISCNDNYES